MNPLALLLILTLPRGHSARLTPGALCTPGNRDFDGYRYPAHVAHCRRNVSDATKVVVAGLYGIERADWGKYEFDHFIPLSIGGSNSIYNIWPQLLADAAKKDAAEEKAYRGLKNGTLTQKQAIALVKSWRRGR